MDYLEDGAGARIYLDELEASKRIELLNDARHGKYKAYCGCEPAQSERQQLVVAIGPDGSIGLRRWPRSGSKHDPLACPRFGHTRDTLAARGWSPQAARLRADGSVVLRLEDDLRLSQSERLTESRGTYKTKTGVVVPVRHRVTTLGLLDHLFSLAGLTEFDPKIGRPARSHLRLSYALDKVDLHGVPRNRLGANVVTLLPASTYEGMAPRNHRTLQSNRGKRRVLFISIMGAGDARLLRDGDIELNEFGPLVRLPASVKAEALRSSRSASKHLRQGGCLAAIGVATVLRNDAGDLIAVADRLALRVLTKNLVPANSVWECEAFEQLESLGRHYKSQPKYDRVLLPGAHPDGWLLDVACGRAPFEIFAMRLEEYVDGIDGRINEGLANFGADFWYWDRSRGERLLDALKRLPPKTAV